MNTLPGTNVVDNPPNTRTGNSGSTLWAALIRSAWSSVAAALLAGFTTYQTIEGTMPDNDAWRKAVLVAAISFLGPFAVRGGVEGVYDAGRQKAGNATPADVTPTPIP